MLMIFCMFSDVIMIMVVGVGVTVFMGLLMLFFTLTYLLKYSRGEKSVIFCFALLLPQILEDFQNQGQF